MSLIGKIFGDGAATRAVGETAGALAEVFTKNQTRQMERAYDVQAASLAQFSVESDRAAQHWFGQYVDGLNRLPRPCLALGTVGLFVYAMVEPSGFTLRMQGLSSVPEPLWWLLGAIVSFYFGAREMHYFRQVKAPKGPAPQTLKSASLDMSDPAANAALNEWHSAIN